MEPLGPGPGSFGTHRRRFLQGSLAIAGLGLGLSPGPGWLTPVSAILAAEADRRREPPRSIILIWLAGGPSQLETFDPHPGTAIAGGTRAIDTSVRKVKLAEGYGRLAEVLGDCALVRSIVSKEGDHERGTYLLKTGYRPDATIEHPSIGAICCHELPVGSTEIPRHVSILSAQWPARGGFLGGAYDAFQIDDPAGRLPDIKPTVAHGRDATRSADLSVVDRAFAAGRAGPLAATLHQETIQRARTMMTSEQLQAFDVSGEPLEWRRAYGETPFGRACLAARRLTEVGVRCVEVTLSGWDAHVNNHAIHQRLARELDPALSALVHDLKQRGRLGRTVVVCAGEFGRTPKLNRLEGRDHWPTGFSAVLAGGSIQGGRVVGATDPEGRKPPSDPVPIANLHATVLRAVGIDPTRENISPIGRPIALSEGKPLEELLDA